jgi:hypothetical protein
MTTSMHADHHLTEEYLDLLEESGLITIERPSFLVLHVAAACPDCAPAVERWRSRPRVGPLESPSVAWASSSLAARTRQAFEELQNPGPAEEQWAELLTLLPAERETWVRTQEERLRPPLVKLALSALRQSLAAGRADAASLSGLVVTLAETVVGGEHAPSTLLADLLVEASLLQAQAWLASGWFGEAARLTLATQQRLLPEGSGDALLDIEVEATSALLAFAYHEPAASLLRWQEAGRVAYEIKDPFLIGQAATAEAWVRLISGEPEKSRQSFAKPQGIPSPHWIGVLERIEVARRERRERERVN